MKCIRKNKKIICRAVFILLLIASIGVIQTASAEESYPREKFLSEKDSGGVTEAILAGNTGWTDSIVGGTQKTVENKTLQGTAKATKKAFEKLTRRMSLSEATELMGPPKEIKRDSLFDTVKCVWEYENGDKVGAIFESNRLREKRDEIDMIIMKD